MAGPPGGLLAVGAGGGHPGGLLGQARGRPCGPPLQPDLPGRFPGGADPGCVVLLRGPQCWLCVCAAACTAQHGFCRTVSTA